MRLSRYLVRRRLPPHAVNDNRNPRHALAWQWALAVAPTLTAALLLTALF